MLKLTRLLIVLVLVIAACGGDEEAGDAGSGDTDGGETTTTTTTTATTTTTTAVSGGGGGDFCDFVAAQAQAVTPSPVGLSPAEVEENYTGILDTITMAAQIAPDEIQGDVQLFVDAYGGLVDFLGDYDFNFLAIPEGDLEDPRLAALDDPELEAAGERIEEFCGIDSFIETPPAGGTPAPGGDTGAGPLPGAGIPADFPGELIPPNGTVLATVEVGGAQSITWDVESTLDDLVEFYTELLGPPTATTADGALWVAQFNGTSTTVALEEASPSLVNMNVTYGP